MKVAKNDEAQVRFWLNGADTCLSVSPAATLQQVLQDQGLREVRYGCGEGVCGACLVLLNGRPTASCITLAMQADGGSVVTAVGLEAAIPDTARERFLCLRSNLEVSAAFQCGYCACGMLVAAAHTLSGGPGPYASQIHQALSGNLCRCTGYHQILEALTASEAGERVRETFSKRPDVVEKMGPNAGYPTDRHIKDALVGRILWSEYPSAHIRAIDVKAARLIPGVFAVLTHDDIPGCNVGGTMTFAEDQPLLASDQVCSMGDAVALVAARNDLAARNALQKIHVTYDPRSAVKDVTEALAEGAPLLRPFGNVISQFTEETGNIDFGFAASDLVVEGTYRCSSNDHSCMELEGGCGWIENEQIVLELQSQSPYSAANAVAKQLGIPQNQIRIESTRMGGSFGKYLVAGVEGFLGMLVFATKRPVRLVLSRGECLERRVKRHATLAQYRLGLKKDGSFTALEARILVDAGPYTSLTPAVTSVLTSEVTGAYEIANVRVDCKGVLTNNLPPAPMRGFGSQQANFGIECLIDKAARCLAMDPVELRRKNYKGRSRKRGGGTSSPYIWLQQTMDAVTAGLGPRPVSPEGWRVGRGVASAYAKYGYPLGMVDRFVARIQVDASGKFLLESDVSDAGSGSVQGACHIVARELKLQTIPAYSFSRNLLSDPTGTLLSRGSAPSRFASALFRRVERMQTIYVGHIHAMTSRLSPTSLTRLMRWTSSLTNLTNRALNGFKSSLFPFSVDSFNPRISGSRGIFMLGMAAQRAAQNLRKTALAVAAQKLDVAADSLELGGGGIYERDRPSSCITWAELANSRGGSLHAIGESHLPLGWLFESRTGNQVGPVDFVFASHGCDIAINSATGKVKILSYVACHDVGRALDLDAIRGQLFGGITMGLAQALLEDLELSNCRVKNAGLHDYLVPSSLDIPEKIDLHIIESGTGLGPEGAKGIGEIAAVAAPVAVANAVYDALNVQPTAIPITPEHIVCELMAR